MLHKQTCIFCEFVTGSRKKNVNGFPFIQLHTTRLTTSFIATDCPPHGAGQILVIPKKHYEHIEDLPKTVRHALMDHVSLACRVVRKEYPACNVLLNNGEEAGQTVFHVHFHVIPRLSGDAIEIEVWDRKPMTAHHFRTLSKQYQSAFRKIGGNRAIL
ncbi:MAG: HIT family protein [bacterium]|nr:HIT family protein [bacterium]